MKPSPENAPSVRRRLLRFLLVPLAVLLGIGIFTDYQTGALPIRLAYDQVLQRGGAGDRGARQERAWRDCRRPAAAGGRSAAFGQPRHDLLRRARTARRVD
jgi:hypothetical protein